MSTSISNKRGNLKLMLLGSSEKLPYRRKVKRKLLKMGFNKIIIMEELERNLDDGSLDEQFESIVAKLKLDVFFAIFHKNAKNVNGVVFEIGWLCGKFGSRIIGDKLKFIFENKYDFNKEGTSAYIQALFNKITRVEFDDSIEYSTCWEIIRTYTPMLKNRR